MRPSGWLHAMGVLAALLALAACTTAGADQVARSGSSGGSVTVPPDPPQHSTGAAGQAALRSGLKVSPTAPSSVAPSSVAPPPAPAPPFRHPLAGMPLAIGNDVYAATRAGKLSPRVADDPAYLYVPDSNGTTTTVIDQQTHKIVRVIHSGQLSQHVNPSYDLRTLYADASVADRLQRIDPKTAKPQGRIAVPRPYNLYFTPDGSEAVVVVEQYNRILFADPKTFKPRSRLEVPGCLGPNHADFSANGRSMVITCEFSATLVKISTVSHRVQARVQLPPGSIPQDVRLSPDGRTYYVADLGRDMVRIYNWRHLNQVGRIRTPAMPHGLILSRDGRFLYVTDRGAGAISVVSFARRKIVDTWKIPGGGSPDMGGVSANGRFLWVSGRYDGVVYGFDTRSGKLIDRIQVGGSPHGLLLWPQPGRYSMGHTGNMR